MMKPDLWIDGKFVKWDNAHFHPLSHSLQRGATLFESIDCAESNNGLPVIFRLRDHMARFEESARLIGMPLKFNLEELMDAVIRTVLRSGLKVCTIRPIAFYADPVLDVYPGNSKVSVVIGVGEKSHKKEYLRMKISSLRKIDGLSMPIKAKVSGNYIASVIAKTEAIEAGFDDAILLDRDGFVAEGATSNIFMVENNNFYTAPGEKILQGITRDTLFNISEKLGLKLIEEQFDPARLKASDEVFMCSSGMGVMPVILVDDTTIGDGKPGPQTSRLRVFYNEITTGKLPEFEKWLTYVRG
jgi:branched-chain amino acid aminotransferase